jgi:hypothetical protein
VIVPAEVKGRLGRQRARYDLRAVNRKVSRLKRVQTCGLPIGGGDVMVRVNQGVHHYSGVWFCGSGWACPVCAAKIRFKRADEVSRAVVMALSEGMGALFVTRTIPHSAEDSLGVTLGLLAEGRRYVAAQRQVKRLRARAGYVGGIASKEITRGYNGWHPHTHDIELFERDLGLEDYAALSYRYYDYLATFYEGREFPGLSREHGVTVEQVTMGGGALARYLAKLQEGASYRLHVSGELARSDLKRGRAGHILPFDILAEFANTGDMAALDLWHEYERETIGKSVIRFTKGLRARLLTGEQEKTDEELAREEVGGADAVRFAGWFYRKVARVPGLEAKVLTALDTGGFAALVELLTVYHLDEPGGYYRIEDTSE